MGVAVTSTGNQAIDDGVFADEIVPLKITGPDGSVTSFTVDESPPRRGTTMERLEALPVLHPEIPEFSITAGNSSGTNDAAAAMVVMDSEIASSAGLNALGGRPGLGSGRRRAEGHRPRGGGLRDRQGARPHRIVGRRCRLWEINEAFASVPIAACREFGIDEELVNIYGSGCSLGHPIAASGARMLTTLFYELNRRGGGIGVAAMCAGGGQGGAVVIEV